MNHRDDEPETRTPDEWDQAAAAREIANNDARTRRRSGRTKRQKKASPVWDGAAKKSESTGVDLDSQLLDIEKKFRSLDPKQKRRQSSSTRRLPAVARIFIVALLIAATTSLIVYMVIAALRQPTTNPLSQNPSRDKPTIIPSLLPTPAPAPQPRQFTIVDASDPQFDPVKKTVTDFLASRSLQDRLALLRPTPDVRSHLEASLDAPLLQLNLTPSFGPAFIVSGNFVYAEILEAGIGTRGAILEKTGDRYLLDFDSLIGYSDADWPAIAKLQLDTPVTTRALVRLLPDRETAIVSDPAQNHSITASISLLGITDDQITGTLSTGQLLPYIIELDIDRRGPQPRLHITGIQYSGWFPQNLFR